MASIKKLFILIFLIINFTIKINCQGITWYDTEDHRNPDFDKDIVKEGTFVSNFNSIYYDGNQIVYDGDNPTYDNSGNIIMINNEKTFNAWTHGSDPTVTLEGFGVLNGYNYDTQNFYSDSFFPVDGLGFGNGGDDHNYKWCSKIVFKSHAPLNSAFPMELLISHSDDLILYVNGEFVYHYFGINEKNSIQYDLSMFAISPGEQFDTIIINCNRKRRDGYHLLDVQSSFFLHCDEIDACGVCMGDNSTCQCVKNKNCHDDEYLCIKKDCVGVSTCQESKLNCTKQYPGNLCVSQECRKYHGCVSTDILCDDHNHCTDDKCDPTFGCVHILILGCQECNDKGCITTDSCVPVECDPLIKGHCIEKPINCTHPNPCIIGECNSIDGECVYSEIIDCIPENSSSDGPISSSNELTTTSTVATIVSTVSTVSTISLPTLTLSSIGTTGVPTSTISTIAMTIARTLGSTISRTVSSTAISGIPTTSTISSTSSLSSLSSSLSSSSSSLSSSLSSSTTSVSSTISTLSPYDGCSHQICGKGFGCFNVNHDPICVKTKCLSCYDLDCKSQNLKCVSIKLDSLPNDKCDDCCPYISSCSP